MAPEVIVPAASKIARLQLLIAIASIFPSTSAFPPTRNPQSTTRLDQRGEENDAKRKCVVDTNV